MDQTIYNKIIKLSSYSENFPDESCTVKVAVKPITWEKEKKNDSIRTFVYENADYEGGFVSIDGGKSYHLAYNFLFHKLKRIPIKYN